MKLLPKERRIVRVRFTRYGHTYTYRATRPIAKGTRVRVNADGLDTTATVVGFGRRLYFGPLKPARPLERAVGVSASPRRDRCRMTVPHTKGTSAWRRTTNRDPDNSSVQRTADQIPPSPWRVACQRCGTIYVGHCPNCSRP
jgi:hypothetical protein